MEELNNKLIQIQAELKAPKDSWNDFSKYKYRSAESILEALKPLLYKHGLVITMTDTPILVGTWNYIEAEVTLSDGKNSLTVKASARETETKKGMDSSQITGATSSYARKYALGGMFAIDDTKDADSQDNRPAAPKKPQVTKPDPLKTAKSNLMAALTVAGHDNAVKQKAAVLQVLQKSTIDTIDEANEVMQALEDGIL